jgi:hypothetical protein
MLVTVIVEVPGEPVGIVRFEGLAVIVKSAAWAAPRFRNASEMRAVVSVRVVIMRALIVLVSFRLLILIFIFSFLFLGTCIIAPLLGALPEMCVSKPVGIEGYGQLTGKWQAARYDFTS